MCGGSIGELEELRDALAEHDSRYASLALAAARMSERGDWADDGSLTMAAWLRRHARMSDNDASTLLRHGTFLRRFEPMAAAALSGRLSHGQVAAMRRAVRPATEALFAEHAESMVGILEPLDVRDTVIAAKVWQARAEALVDPAAPIAAPAELSFTVDEQGQAIGRFVLSADGTIDFEKAIANASTYGGDDDTRTSAERRADALEDICAFFNANHDRSGTPRHRPHAEVIVEEDRPVRTIDGRVLDDACAGALLCDCVMHRVLKAGSTILDYGRATRSIPYPTFRALAIRDGGCRMPGCCRPVAWTDGHHIHHWEHGGATDLDNLVLLCRRHHRMVHRLGWHVKLLPDATVEITLPDGTTMTSTPRGSPELGSLFDDP